jgi:hypothetical protein
MIGHLVPRHSIGMRCTHHINMSSLHDSCTFLVIGIQEHALELAQPCLKQDEQHRPYTVPAMK